jgi:hypothetical protein
VELYESILGECQTCLLRETAADNFEPPVWRIGRLRPMVRFDCGELSQEILFRGVRANAEDRNSLELTLFGSFTPKTLGQGLVGWRIDNPNGNTLGQKR